MSLQKLRSIVTERLDNDDAIEMITIGRAAVTTYESYKVPVPQWLTDGLASLDAEMKKRRADMIEARRREIKANLATLQTREEKRASLEQELADLGAAG